MYKVSLILMSNFAPTSRVSSGFIRDARNLKLDYSVIAAFNAKSLAAPCITQLLPLSLFQVLSECLKDRTRLLTKDDLSQMLG